jgi:transposase
MAPNLAACQHALIHDMILAGYKNAVIARTANCRASLVRRIRANIISYGLTRAPPNGVGRCRLLNPPMLTVLLDRLAVKPNMYRDEMVEFLKKEFKTTIPASNISRSLRSAR